MAIHELMEIGYQGKQEENEYILENAIKQFWILCAAANEKIPEMSDHICRLQRKVSEEFEPVFLKMLDKVIFDLEQESFILKIMTFDFAKLC